SRARAGGPYARPGLPGQMSGPRQLTTGLTKVLPVVVIGLLIAFALFPGLRRSAGHDANRVGTAIRQLISPHFTVDKPNGVSATSEQPQAPAYNVFDEITGTYWATAAPDNGIGQSITASFAGKGVRIDQMIFTIGTGVPATYESESRPQRVRVDLLATSGKLLKSAQFTLNDTFSPQNESIHATGVAKAEVTILGVYPSTQAQNCAIDEIEYFQKD
ncbi:MAG: NADase-type glycan-binding domain-containing protein, partial [Candidatus Dormibacteria bacterium]